MEYENGIIKGEYKIKLKTISYNEWQNNNYDYIVSSFEIIYLQEGFNGDIRNTNHYHVLTAIQNLNLITENVEIQKLLIEEINNTKKLLFLIEDLLQLKDDYLIHLYLKNNHKFLRYLQPLIIKNTIQKFYIFDLYSESGMYVEKIHNDENSFLKYKPKDFLKINILMNKFFDFSKYDFCVDKYLPKIISYIYLTFLNCDFDNDQIRIMISKIIKIYLDKELKVLATYTALKEFHWVNEFNKFIPTE